MDKKLKFNAAERVREKEIDLAYLCIRSSMFDIRLTLIGISQYELKHINIINIKIWTCLTCLGIFRILIFILYIFWSLTYVRTGCERCSLGSLRCLSEFVGPGRCAPCDEGHWTPLDVRTSEGHQNGHKVTKSDRFFDYVFRLRKDYIWATSHNHISHSHITHLKKN